MVKPPLIVQQVFEAVLYVVEILFNITPENKEYVVATHKQVLAIPSLVDRMKDVTLSQINERLDEQSRGELATFIAEAKFTVQSVEKSSKPASHFWEWILELNSCLELLAAQPTAIKIVECGEEKRKLQLCATLNETSSVRYSSIEDESIRQYLTAVSIARVLDNSLGQQKCSGKASNKKR
jgi:hypothetical protein